MLGALLRRVRGPLTSGARTLFAPTARADVWTPPSRKSVADYAARQLVGVVLVVAAAALCWRADLAGQALPLGVIAASRVPDLLVAALALADKDRRTGLRPSRRPGVLAAVLAAALGVGALVSVLGGGATTEWLAALVAAAGLAASAWPTQLVYPAPQRRSRPESAAQTGTSSTAPTA